MSAHGGRANTDKCFALASGHGAHMMTSSGSIGVRDDAVATSRVHDQPDASERFGNQSG